MLNLANFTSSYRARLIVRVYKKWLKPKNKVLDIGCGTGIVAYELEKSLGINVKGCDINQYLLRKINFKKMKSSTILPYEIKSFDYSMFNDVLHHTGFDKQEKLLKEALRVSKIVLIFELIPNTLGKILDFLINKIHYHKMDIPFTYRTPDEWRVLFSKIGLKVECIVIKKPFLYPFNHICFKLSGFRREI